MKYYLMGFELLRELVHTTIMTGRVQGHNPVSLLLIAEPERGKTSIALERPCKAVIAVNDATGRGLQEACRYNPELTHIILTDLVTVMAHRQTVTAYTISMLNAMTEEGIKGTLLPGGLQVFENGVRGIIACLTPTLAKDQRQWWNKSGFSSRMLPFNYEHSKDLMLQIKTAIVSERGARANRHQPETLLIPDHPLAVEMDKPTAEAIRKLAEGVARGFEEIGYRRIKQFMSLGCAHAIIRTWKHPRVTDNDFRFLERIVPFISYTQSREL